MVLWIFGNTRNLGEIVEINKNSLLDQLEIIERFITIVSVWNQPTATENHHKYFEREKKPTWSK